MKTLLMLVDDAYADTLKEQLPGDKAWILDARYDTFRCQLRQALDAYLESPEDAEAYHDTLARMDEWLATETER
jgi:hypothetical protein